MKTVHLEIEEGRVRLSLSKLEGPKQDTNTYPDTVGEKETLAKIANSVSHTRFIRRVITRGIRTTKRSSTLSTLELFNCLTQALLRLAEAALGIRVVVVEK